MPWGGSGEMTSPLAIDPAQGVGCGFAIRFATALLTTMVTEYTRVPIFSGQDDFFPVVLRTCLDGKIRLRTPAQGRPHPVWKPRTVNRQFARHADACWREPHCTLGVASKRSFGYSPGVSYASGSGCAAGGAQARSSLDQLW